MINAISSICGYYSATSVQVVVQKTFREHRPLILSIPHRFVPTT